MLARLFRAAAVLGVLVLPGALSALDAPPLVKDAVLLELDGRLGEALDRYRAALSTEPSLVQDEGAAQPLTVRVLAKAAHLSIDLGYGEEAWDLAARLLAAKTQAAVEAGTLVRLRILRLQGKTAEALAFFEAYAKQWPLPAPGPRLLAEVGRIRAAQGKGAGAVEALLVKAGGPAAWTLQGTWLTLPGATEALGLEVQETVRLQIGAFKDWGNALTLVDMLREKGWSPFTEVKTNASGDKLHVVYVVSRQPASDKARLEAQGLLN
jgi:hypothetical protein